MLKSENKEMLGCIDARMHSNLHEKSYASMPLCLYASLVIFVTFLVMLNTASPAFCAPISIKQTAVKFLFAMGGVALSSFIIFAGLTVYNKIFVKKSKADEDDDLSTPNSIDDAVVFFIKKNKLR